MAALTEENILDSVYTLIEGDTSDWASTSDEYLAGRRYANLAIGTWEKYQNTRWRDLFTTLTASTQNGLVKTLTAATYTYACPSDMVFPSSFIRTVDSSGNATIYDVVKPERIAELTGQSGNYCYFTGSVKAGYTLNFNPKLTLTTGHTINYEYYKAATLFTTTASTTEMSDSNFIVLYVASMFYKDEDPDLYKEFMGQAMSRLESMRTDNEMGYFGVDDRIEGTLTDVSEGFGN